MSDHPGSSAGHGDGWIGRPLKRREDHRLLTGAGAAFLAFRRWRQGRKTDA